MGKSNLLPSSSVSSTTAPTSCSSVPSLVCSPMTPPPTHFTLASGAVDGALLQHHRAMSVSPRPSFRRVTSQAQLPQRAGLTDGSDSERSRRRSPRALSPLVSGSSVASAPMFTPRPMGGSLQFSASPHGPASSTQAELGKLHPLGGSANAPPVVSRTFSFKK